MGVIINKLAFPSDIPSFDYSNMLKSKLFSIDVEVSATKTNKIYGAVFKPVEQPRATIVYCHANGETLGLCAYVNQIMCDLYKCRVVAFDWEGYGMSQGTASELSLKRSSEAIFEYCRDLFPDEPIIVWGRSIGTVAATHLAAHYQQDTAALLLQSPMASAFNIVFESACCSVADGLQNQLAVRNVRCPVFIVHGLKDSTIPFRNAEMVFQACIASRRMERILQRADGDSEEGVEDLVAETVKREIIEGLDLKIAGQVRLYTVRNGDHNNLDMIYRRQMKHIADDIINIVQE